MNLWFASSRYGMTLQQKLKVQEFLVNNKNVIQEIRHGDEIGGEEEFHKICLDFGLIDKIIIHPPNVRTNRALCKSPNIIEPRDSRRRRITMADKSDLLLATTHNEKENIRLGCWQSVRIAREKEKNIILIFPDGSIYDNI